jgi:hypothetical protein
MLHLLRDTITIYSTPAIDEYGKNQFSAGVVIKCRFVEKTKVILGPTGENITAEAEVWLAPDTDVVLDDKLLYGTQGYRVVQIAKQRDMTNVKFIKCLLERYEI